MSKNWSLKGKNNKISYISLNIDNSTKEKDCLKADKDNQKKYSIIVKKAEETNKKWNITGATINIKIPHPPKPNNYEKYVNFKKNNIPKPCLLQSKATLFLYQRGFEIEKDYKAYEAIDIYNKIMDTINLENIDEENIIQNHILEYLQYKDEERLPNIKRKVLRNKTLSRRRINNKRNGIININNNNVLLPQINNSHTDSDNIPENNKLTNHIKENNVLLKNDSLNKFLLVKKNNFDNFGDSFSDDDEMY